ncbi:MAG: hypothetical protein JRJ44_02175 [Deltaproteobacteria bacterium]|nr:hypothetical protein [Deltaproteobacteria bacterium]
MDEFKRYGITKKRMLDKDFITRFVAFRIHTLQEYKPSLDNFLNTSMARLKSLSIKEREQIKADFKKALQVAWDIFGEYAYRKQYSMRDKKKPFNKALFESWNIALYRLKEEEIKIVIEKKIILIKKFIKLLNEDKEFEKSISSSTSGRKHVEKRFSSIENLIKEALK